MSEVKNTLFINGKELPIDGERNLIDLARKHGIFIPTFCYHPNLPKYGACRLCLVEIEKMGLQAACCISPRPGMVIKTNSEEVREVRKVALELLLANHRVECPTCAKADNCDLLALSKKYGIKESGYYKSNQEACIDASSPSLVRDNSKCILCGQCVRACKEIQGIGVLDFAYRGSKSKVIPAFGKDLASVECVNCGLCSKVCPTGAIMLKDETNDAFAAIDSNKVTVASIAPAVRTAIGEMFGLEASEDTTGKIAAALKALGFDYVFDTSWSADLTILEEGTELVKRLTTEGSVLPQFTSCCPAWVKYCEEFYPELIPNLSSAKSPQQMIGAAIKEFLPGIIGKTREDIYNVSIMPCTAKKYEAKRPEFNDDYDLVLTTQELGNMIKAAGIDFANLEPIEFDNPFGMKTGAGVIFGVTGGVMEAALRYAYEVVTGDKLDTLEFMDVRGFEGIKEAEVDLKGTKVKICVVHTLSKAKEICDMVKAGKCNYHFIEVMTCPGGCINGAGQPAGFDCSLVQKRSDAIYKADIEQKLRKSQDNPFVQALYKDYIKGEPFMRKIRRIIPYRLYS
ncbi:MAG: [FeFe] hydrogenase, group A [Armatimonadetes bacterium]|nr:[FeFe] hydrogenase, group A [Candidatus Hippobium faecium]